MKVAIVTGSAGLIGSEAARFFAQAGFKVVGVDNDMRSYFFGEQASTAWTEARLREQLGAAYEHHGVDIRDTDALDGLFARYGRNVELIVHTAAQPSHDWAAREPHVDFTVNANGTLALLEAYRKHSPEATFIFTSTNKVYGDSPNRLPLVELPKRWEIEDDHHFRDGIDETMTIDQSTHSLFGASKAAADLLVQEYGRYFGLKTGVFRGGCLTGPSHSGAPLHGFLAYLMDCTLTGRRYSVLGYGGKQVRDNIHSRDLVSAFYHFYMNPRPGEVYNIGGSRHSNCSMLEAIEMCQNISGRTLDWTYEEDNRVGDHIWYISDVGKFRSHFPDWQYEYGIEDIIKDIYEGQRLRLAGAGA